MQMLYVFAPIACEIASSPCPARAPRVAACAADAGVRGPARHPTRAHEREAPPRGLPGANRRTLPPLVRPAGGDPIPGLLP